MPRKSPVPSSISGFGFIYQRGKYWWMRYKAIDGKMLPAKSTRLTDKAAAYAELLRQAGRYGYGEIVGGVESVTFAALFGLLEKDYIRKNRSTLADMKARVEKHLRPWFGKIRVQQLRKKDLHDFIDSRLNGFVNEDGETEKLKPASVNKLISYLRRAMRLGMKEDPPLVLRVPLWFEALEEDNVRTGFVTEETYRALLAVLPEHARLALVIGYHLGMRRGEILGLRWDQVDLATGVISLERSQTKAKKARVAPIYGDMWAFLDMARSAKNPKCEYVVQFEGRRVFDIKTTWRKACVAVQAPTTLVHDLRRTAATNMDAVGISRARIMDCVGWETEAMFRRYNIGTVKAAVEVGRQMEEAMAQTPRVEMDTRRAN